VRGICLPLQQTRYPTLLYVPPLSHLHPQLVLRMPYLIESVEWRLVRELGRLFGERKASHQVKPLGRHHDPVHSTPVHPTVEHIEVELRRLLILQDIPQDLDDADFEACRAALRRVCLCLDSLASERLIPTGSIRGAVSYPRLRALLEWLDSAFDTADLVHGPNTKLFTLPRGVDELYDCLGTVTDCCRALNKLLFAPSAAASAQPRRIKENSKSKDAWKKARVRKQATVALETLFKHFKCGTAHEVLLRLTEDTDMDASLPTLQMMLSRCPELESWLEARCESLHL
jgi:hypothetical protein